jgi:hypothetical protein
LDKHDGLVQSLLLLVEDANDNPPLFIQPPTSVTVKESGAFQLKYLWPVLSALIFSKVLNKQLFSSLKIRRCMLCWTKCLAGKSPTRIKNPDDDG